MAYCCDKCGRTWPDDLAKENEFVCSRKCSGVLIHLVSEYSAADLPPGSPFPYPAALAIERLRASLIGNSSAWDRITLYKDAVEAVVKSFCIYQLGGYLNYPGRSPERDEILLDLLVRPSTGQWVELLGVLCKYLKQETGPAGRIYELFFRPVNQKDEPSTHFQMLLDFVPFRNELHHSTRRSESDYQREIQSRLPTFSSLLKNSEFLAAYPLLRAVSGQSAERWAGPSAGIQTDGAFEMDQQGHFGYFADGGKFVNVEPFVLFLDCDSCNTDRLFLYDSQKSYGTSAGKKRIYMQEYDGGHRPHRPEPVGPLEERFSRDLLQRVYNAFRKKMVAIEQYLKDFSAIVEQHSEIIGREFLKTGIHQFLEDQKSGIYLLTGEPGIGKTAMMASLVESELGRIHFFYRHTSGLRSPDDFVNCILNSLLNKYRLQLQESSSDPRIQRVQLQNLLPKISQLLKPGEKEVIVVDALDEAGHAYDGATAAQLLPRELPENLYFIVSSRPGNPDLKLLASRGDLEEFELRAESADNREDAFEYVRSRLSEQVDEDACRRMAEQAEWNFLFLKLLCDAIRKDDYSPSDMAGFLSRSTGLQDWYGEYWERLQRRFEDQPERLEKINAVIGAIAAAGGLITREQICESLKMPPSEFDWCLRFVGQYLDVIPIAEEGIGKPGGRELVLYRLYHFSFREFVLAKVHPQLAPFHLRWSHHLANWHDLEGHEREYALRFLPHHLVEGSLWKDLQELLTGIDFLESKCAAGMTYELISDYQEAICATAAAGAREECSILEEFGRFIRSQAHRLTGDPGSLFPLAISLPDHSAPARLWNHEKQKRIWIEWINKPQDADPCRMTLISQASEARGCCFSPDGTRILARLSNTPSAWEGLLKIWNSETGEELLVLKGHSTSTSACCYSPDGKQVLSAGVRDQQMKIWNAETGEEIRTIGSHRWGVLCCDYSPDGKQILSGSWDYLAKIWDVETGDEIRTLAGHEGGVNDCAFSPDGRLIVTASSDKRLYLWSAPTGAHLVIFYGHEDGVTACAFSSDSSKIVSASKDKTLRVWEVPSEEELASLEMLAESAPVGDRRYVELFPEILTLEGHSDWVRGCAFSPDGKNIVSCSKDSTLKIWDVESAELIATLEGHSDWVRGCAYSPDGKWIVSASSDGMLRLWDAGAQSTAGSMHTDWVAACTFSPDGKAILSASDDKSMKLWDAQTGENLLTWAAHSDWVRTCAISPDGSRFVSGSKDKTLTIWDSNTHEPLNVLQGHTDTVRSCVWSPDGSRLVSGSLDNYVRVWDPVNGRKITGVPAHSDAVWCCAYSPDGRILASTSSDKTIKFWDAQRWKCILSLPGHTGSVRFCSFSPDGKQIASVADDGTLRIWDIRSGTVEKILALSNGFSGKKDSAVVPAGACSFLPDNCHVVTGSRDGRFLLWHSKSGEVTGAFYAKADLGTVAVGPVDCWTAGDGSGRLYILRARGAAFGRLVTTAVRLYSISEQKWNESLQARCGWCNRYFDLPAGMEQLLRDLSAGPGSGSPCLNLPEEAWEEPALFVDCPECHGALRLNPFFVDNRAGNWISRLQRKFLS